MADETAYGLVSVWSRWKRPDGESINTFAIFTMATNEVFGQVRDRMPVVPAPGDDARWFEPKDDPRDLLVPRAAGGDARVSGIDEGQRGLV